MRFRGLLFCAMMAIGAPVVAFGQTSGSLSLSGPSTGGSLVTPATINAAVNAALAAKADAISVHQTFNVLSPTCAGGADPTGTTDSAPAFQACMGSNRRVLIPPGTYLFNSTQTAPCCAYDATAVLVQSFSNFVIDGAGATITIGSGIALSSAFQFDQDHNFVVKGLTITGNRTGLTSAQENAGIALSSDTNFTIEKVHFGPGFGGQGTGIAGDWMVNGAFRDLTFDGVGQCFDFGFALHLRFSHFDAVGADTNGLETSGHVGTKCFSLIWDSPNSAQNNTGITFPTTNVLPGPTVRTQSDDILVSGGNVANFVEGGLVTTGTHLGFYGNDWHENPGLGGSPGIGLLIDWLSSFSLGVPPSDITISDNFVNNGSAVAGYALFISAAGISNSDTMGNILVTGSHFTNNSSVGINTDTASRTLLPNFQMWSNTFSGALQTLGVGVNALDAALFAENSNGNMTLGGALSLGGVLQLNNNTAINSLDASAAPQPMMFGDASNETVIRPLSNASDVRLQTPAATLMAQFFGTSIVLYPPVTLGSHLIGSGTFLTSTNLSACGTSPSMLTAYATDLAGTIVEGTTATGCVLTFTTAFGSNPDCTLSSPNGAPFTGYTPTTTTLTITNASASGNKYTFHCIQ